MPISHSLSGLRGSEAIIIALPEGYELELVGGDFPEVNFMHILNKIWYPNKVSKEQFDKLTNWVKLLDDKTIS